MKRCHRNGTVRAEHGLPVDRGEHADVVTDRVDDWRANEDPVERLVEPVTSSSASKESIWRPYPLRRDTIGMADRQCWSARPSSIRSEHRIMPAQVPKTGMPSATR